MKLKEKYVAFLRGINVGGHHKVPMVELKNEFQKLGFENIVSLLNSGNIIFEASSESASGLEKKVSEHLHKSFGFLIPTIIRKSEMLEDLLKSNPFKGVDINKDTRLYVSFLREHNKSKLTLPWKSADNSYEIIGDIDKTIFSILDLSLANTSKAMEAFEKFFGKDVTTRNWKTVERIGKKLEAGE